MSRQIDLLDKSKSPAKLIFLLAWPAVIEQLLQMVVTYVDTAMVGSMGVNATAAVAVNSPVIFMINGFMMGLGLAASILTSKHIGEREFDAARQVIRQAVFSMAVLAIIVFAVIELVLAHNLALWMGADEEVVPLANEYIAIVGIAQIFQIFLVVSGNIIRGTGDTKSPMVYNFMNNIINLIANFLLIYPTRDISIFGFDFTMWGAGLGVAGAAWGTTIAAAITGTIMTAYLFKPKSIVGISIRDGFRPDKAVLSEIMILAAPVTFERFVHSLGQTTVTAMATGLGSISLAAHQLANTAETICYLPVAGFSVASTTAVAQSLGAGDKELAKKYADTCLKTGVMIMIAAATIMYIFTPQLIGLFIDDWEVISLGAFVLRIQVFAEPFMAITMIIGGVLKGGGDTKWPFYMSTLGMWIVRIPLSLVLIHVFGMGLTGIWIPMGLDWLTRAIVGMIRYRSNKWLHNWN